MAIRRAHKRQEAEAKRRSDMPAAVTLIKQSDGIHGAEAAVARARTADSSAAADLPEELIAARAYEKWRLRGCPMGQDGEQDWFAARAELEAERLGWAAPQAGDDKRSS